MAIRFDDIGNRLRAFRLASGLSADEIARRLDISRAALYRFEKGELAKIETLGKLAELLEVSVPTLLGVGVEYIGSAVAYFERLRQVEANAEQIIVLAGPISYLLASESFDATLEKVLQENIPADLPGRERASAEVGEMMTILKARKAQYLARRPAVVNLISAREIERFLLNGLVGRLDLDEPVRAERRVQARREVSRFAELAEAQPIGTQIGIVPDTLPHTSFQILRQPDRQVLVLSPFRLGEQPNVRIGVAMITSAPEALALHQRAAEEMWQRAMKGAQAAGFLRTLLAR
jgi:transcriptional regulator with XRE-family HTH domain